MKHGDSNLKQNHTKKVESCIEGLHSKWFADAARSLHLIEFIHF